MADLCLARELHEFGCSQQRHGGHCNSARLHHCKPCSGQRRAIWRPQQHTIARYKTKVLGQYPGDTIGLGQKFPIGQRNVVSKYRRTVAVAIGHGLVQQLSRAIHACRILQLRQLKS
jgi:hypothetical protein